VKLGLPRFIAIHQVATSKLLHNLIRLQSNFRRRPF